MSSRTVAHYRSLSPPQPFVYTTSSSDRSPGRQEVEEDEPCPHFLAALQVIAHILVPLRKALIHFYLMSKNNKQFMQRLEWKTLQAFGKMFQAMIAAPPSKPKKQVSGDDEDDDDDDHDDDDDDESTPPVETTEFYEGLFPCLFQLEKSNRPKDATQALQILLETLQTCCRTIPVTSHLWSSLLDAAGLGLVAKQTIVGKRAVESRKFPSSKEVIQRTKKESIMMWCPMVVPLRSSLDVSLREYCSKRPYESYDFDKQGYDFEVRIPLISSHDTDDRNRKMKKKKNAATTADATKTKSNEFERGTMQRNKSTSAASGMKKMRRQRNGGSAKDDQAKSDMDRQKEFLKSLATPPVPVPATKPRRRSKDDDDGRNRQQKDGAEKDYIKSDMDRQKEFLKSLATAPIPTSKQRSKNGDDDGKSRKKKPRKPWTMTRTLQFNALTGYLFIGIDRFLSSSTPATTTTTTTPLSPIGASSTHSKKARRSSIIDTKQTIQIPKRLNVKGLCTPNATTQSSGEKKQSSSSSSTASLSAPDEQSSISNDGAGGSSLRRRASISTSAQYELVGGILVDGSQDYVAILKNPTVDDPEDDDAWKLLETDEVIPMAESDVFDFLQGEDAAPDDDDDDDDDEDSDEEDGPPFGTLVVYRNCDEGAHKKMNQLLSDIIISQVSGKLDAKGDHYYYEEVIVDGEEEEYYEEEIL